MARALLLHNHHLDKSLVIPLSYFGLVGRRAGISISHSSTFSLFLFFFSFFFWAKSLSPTPRTITEKDKQKKKVIPEQQSLLPSILAMVSTTSDLSPAPSSYGHPFFPARLLPPLLFPKDTAREEGLDEPDKKFTRPRGLPPQGSSSNI